MLLLFLQLGAVGCWVWFGSACIQLQTADSAFNSSANKAVPRTGKPNLTVMGLLGMPPLLVCVVHVLCACVATAFFGYLWIASDRTSLAILTWRGVKGEVCNCNIHIPMFIQTF